MNISINTNEGELFYEIGDWANVLPLKQLVHNFEDLSKVGNPQPPFKIIVKHRTGMELVVEEEGRRRLIKARQKKNKRNKRRIKGELKC